jgi:hypothetical protein
MLIEGKLNYAPGMAAESEWFFIMDEGRSLDRRGDLKRSPLYFNI